MATARVFIYSPDHNKPVGGIKKIYDHVDILNKNDIPAFVLHAKDNFKCTWFKNDTQVISVKNSGITYSDYIVLPEIYGPNTADFMPGIKKVILNQNCYYTFQRYNINKNEFKTPYLSPDTIAAIVVSEDSKNYLSYIFPDLKIHRMHYSINPELFSYSPEKKKQICFMPRKNPGDIQQVINILKFRNVLADYELIPLHEMTHEKVAEVIRESLIFMSFGYPEGFGLPPAEAMACGSIAVGYHGMGGLEFFNPEYSYPIQVGDIYSFARAVEEIINIQKNNPEILAEQGKKASDYILNTYTSEREESDIVNIWKEILK